MHRDYDSFREHLERALGWYRDLQDAVLTMAPLLHKIEHCGCPACEDYLVKVADFIEATRRDYQRPWVHETFASIHGAPPEEPPF